MSEPARSGAESESGGSPLTREAARELDRRAIEDWGFPSFALMEVAGRTCAEEAERLLAARPASPACSGPAVVLVGPGNNGGDGLVVARRLAAHDLPVEVVLVGAADAEALARGASEDVQRNLALWLALGREVIAAPDTAAVRGCALLVEGAALVVDALFGTGLSRALGEPYRTAALLLAGAPGARLAVDLPSGLDANTGEVLGACARADTTVTFLATKPGLLRGRGPELAGRVVVEDLGLPRAWVREAAGG